MTRESGLTRTAMSAVSDNIFQKSGGVASNIGRDSLAPIASVTIESAQVSRRSFAVSGTEMQRNVRRRWSERRPAVPRLVYTIYAACVTAAHNGSTKHVQSRSSVFGCTDSRNGPKCLLSPRIDERVLYDDAFTGIKKSARVWISTINR